MKRIVSVLMSIVVVLSCVVFIMPPDIVSAANNADDIVSIARGELGSTNYSTRGQSISQLEYLAVLVRIVDILAVILLAVLDMMYML